MSEVKLNLIDARNTLVGTVHGSDADRCVAALSAEPETLSRRNRGEAPRLLSDSTPTRFRKRAGVS